MDVGNTIGWTGHIRIVSKYKDGSETVEEFTNLITDAGRILLAQALREPTDCEIKYIAWGDAATPPTAADISLGNELGRKVVTKQEAGGTGETITTVYLSPNDANGQIEELGWFAGSEAGETPGSGVLVARVLWSKLKTELESIQIERTDKIT